MQRIIASILAVIIWFSVVMQFYLIIENRTASVGETIIRFFSFFTILTNTLAAIYFTARAFNTAMYNKAGTLTAITMYITIVGIVYEVLLRHVWQPSGLQIIVDELLHTVNPILVILFWYLFENKRAVAYKQIAGWLIYPVIYLIFILIRGNLSGFYPYPFINVQEIGLNKALINAGLLLLFFIATSSFFIFFGKLISRKKLLPK